MSKLFLVPHKQLAFKTVLRAGCYAAKWLMLHIESFRSSTAVASRANRLINESGEQGDCHRAGSISWSL